ncbi:MAG: hypothetical protein GY759_03160 [Chloroflexi bacterium]|nr:hypothetical protein [Chloroflexota bacterium]
MLINRTRILIAGTLLGAIIGLTIAWVASDAESEQELLLAEGKDVKVRPRAKDWITLSVAAITLVRQLADMLEPRT